MSQLDSWRTNIDHNHKKRSSLETTTTCYCFSLFPMLKMHRRPERTCTLHRKIAAAKEDSYDLEAILSAVNNNLLDENQEFTSELNAVVEKVGVHPQSVGFSCDICDKVCKTLRGLTRHRNSKHNNANDVEGDSYQGRCEEFEAEERLP